MPKLPHFELKLEVDDVLRGQGSDPAKVRARNPSLVPVAEQAIHEGLFLIQPMVTYKEYRLQAVRHVRLELQGGDYLAGKLVAQHLAQAQIVIVIVCTIGDRLEKRASEAWSSDMLYGLALDGVGSAAVECLANAACQYFTQQAAAQGMQATIPISPGMIDWSVEEGQPQIFRLLAGEQTGVELTPSFMMTPRKSESMVLGIGPHVNAVGRACDFCNMRQNCRYQDR
jgi:hypothetical protein